MTVSRRNQTLGAVSLLAFSLAATPLYASGAWAEDGGEGRAAAASMSAVVSGIGVASVRQTLAVPGAPGAEKLDLEGFTIAVGGITSTPVGHNFTVEKTIAAAYAEVGLVMRTGWSMPGECIAGAKRWILAGGGAWTGSGDPVANYEGATRVAMADAAPGDIIQYTYVNAPTIWATGVHTVLITGVNGDGTYRIVEQNNPAGSGLVSANDKWTPQARSGLEPVAWRF
ncbi:hypothetical protein GCM10022198_25530 [Klugiella xanthotipulae]|uniref:CHAP domain-containing protein n=1 Tax=Klugiella xanthotipulae TaxID=244735 RepID=A0A543HYY7_9MICO|nr:lipase [Klugiella xanthotipulae]TQM63557.1 hypothetical protein FB466_1823 [Klugiella xanthotipulae]